MKKIVSIVVSAIIVIISGCDKSLSENQTIVGKWMLTDYYIDPGNGSGKWQVADISNPEYLEFEFNGVIKSNKGLSQNFNRYKVLNDSVLQLSSSASANSIESKYALKSGILSIYPPCIEGCGFKYKAAK